MRWIVALVLITGCAPLPVEPPRIPAGITQRLLGKTRSGLDPSRVDWRRAELRRAREAELPREADREGRAGREGDHVLRQGQFSAVVAAIDGTERGGTLVGVADGSWPRSSFESLQTSLHGEPVIYRTERAGRERDCVFVEASGSTIVEAFPVVTRYELCPELDAIFVHTAFLPRSVPGDPTQLVDRWRFSDATWVDLRKSEDFLGAYSGSVGYLVQALPTPSQGPRVVTTLFDQGVVSLALEATPIGVHERAPQVFSRVVTVLDRPDDAALQTAAAMMHGKPVAYLDVELDATGSVQAPLGLPAGRLFAAEIPAGEASRFSLRLPATEAADSHVYLRLPVANYELSADFSDDNLTLTPTAVAVDVLPHSTSHARLVVHHLILDKGKPE